MSQRPDYRSMILSAWGHGAPRTPDGRKNHTQADADNELCSWVDAYFPRQGGGKHNPWTVIRTAFQLRREARQDPKPISSQRGTLTQS